MKTKMQDVRLVTDINSTISGSLLARHMRVQHVFASCGDCGQSRVKEDARARAMGGGRGRTEEGGGQTERQSYAMLNGKWMRPRRRRGPWKEGRGGGHSCPAYAF